jgi:LysM repeat protein
MLDTNLKPLSLPIQNPNRSGLAQLGRVLFAVSGFALCGLTSVTLTGCATGRGGAPASEGPLTLGDVLKQGSSGMPNGPTGEDGPAKAIAVSENGDITVQGVKLKNTQFDYPITINSRVEYWVDYFTGRGRKHFARYLERSEFFIPYIAPLLKQNSMPEDLVYLAMIESGFNNFARSHAKAVGPWQFISATGKRYGLMVNWWVDERRDIRKSTLAAVGYLKDLYTMMGSWELAAASYNAGEAKVARAIQRYGSKDFWVISKHQFLRPETRDYVPKIIAAALIAKNRGQFGFPESEKKPGADEAVAGDGEVVKVVKTDKPLEDNQNTQNPNVVEAVEAAAGAPATPPADGGDWDDEDDAPAAPGGPSHNPITLQASNADVKESSKDSAKDSDDDSKSGSTQPLAKSVPTPHVTKDGQVGGEALAEFEVQSPADMLKIARAAGISYFTVKALNPELLRWCTPPSVASYRIRLPSSVKDKFLQTYNHEAFPRKVTFMTYKVKNGETLNRIASHYGIKVDPISDLNGVSPKMQLRSGVRVLLPIPNDRSRSLASLEVRDPPESKRSRRRRGKYYRISYKKRQSARSRGYHPDQG